MEALILSCGTGGGHNAAAAAVQRAMLARGHRAVLLNPYTLRSERTASAVDNAYVKLVQKAPAVFGAVYGLGSLYRHLPGYSPVYLLNRHMAPVLERYLAQNRYDVILTTHLFPAEILTKMKRQGCAVPKLFFIATDYTCIPFTEETDCDAYIIPSERLRADFLHRGIDADRLYPLGIPVDPQLCQDDDPAALRQKLGLSQEKQYILLAGGSVGAGRLERIVSMLLERFDRTQTELILICGSNRELYARLQALYGTACKVLGFTNRMPAYIKACDLFITKPGGLSSTEGAVAGTPMIHVTPIPGCETRNMEFFEQQGMCIPVSDLKTQLIPACETLLHRPYRDAMRKRQREEIRPQAAEDICRLAEQVCGGLTKM